MGINALFADMLLAEHAYRPIEGTLVSLGHQTIGASLERIEQLMAARGIKPRDVDLEADTQTSHQQPGRISENAFFGLFSQAQLKTLDVSDYEGAEIICDLNRPLPWRYRGVADFIINGSCLDNIFDPVTAIKNMTRMLKPGGRIVQFEQGNSHGAAYLKFSPDWFYDYYAANKFADVKVYVANFPNSLGRPLRSPPLKDSKKRSKNEVEIYEFNPGVMNGDQRGYDCSLINQFGRFEVFVIAEKAKDSTWDVTPIQKHYRTNPQERAFFVDAAFRYRESPRPTYSNGADVSDLPSITESDFPEIMRPVAMF
jgi:SAM-dependent methyltransferase